MQSPSLSRTLLAWLEPLALTSMGLLLLYYWGSNRLGLLIHPMYNGLVAASGVIATGLGVYGVSTRWRRGPEAGHLDSLLSPPLAIGLLFATATLGFAIPPQPLSSRLALQRGAAENFTLANSPKSEFRIQLNPKDRTLIDWTRTLSAFPDPNAYAGQPANIEGFVVRPDQGLPQQVFLLGQFVVNCCAADAYPVTIPVRWDGAGALMVDSWQQVNGSMTVEAIDGTPQLVLVADAVSTIPAPETPYVY